VYQHCTPELRKTIGDNRQQWLDFQDQEREKKRDTGTENGGGKSEKKEKSDQVQITTLITTT